ncbi:MAG: glycosyltransferase 87 family protein [Acidimicrobiales bacterium]
MRSLAPRLALALVLVGVVFALRWDGSLQHFDFQVWEASQTLVDKGLDPYDPEVLNAELHADPVSYGDHWQVENADVIRRMHFFNPPSWLVQLRLVGTSALAMSLAGAIASFGAIAIIDRDRAIPDYLGHLGAAAYVLIFAMGVTTFRFGQIGLLLAGLVGARLVLGSRRSAGTMIALLSFKPHVAVAAAFPHLARRPVRAMGAVIVPLALLFVLTLVWLDPALWRSWVGALVSPDRPEGFDDLSIRTLSSRWTLPDWSASLTLLMGVGAAAYTSLRWQRSNAAVLTLWSMGIVVFTSGHAFSHDWLWIVFIPPVCAWSLRRSLIVSTLFATGYSFAYAVSRRVDFETVSLRSLFGLVVVLYLGWAAYESHRYNTTADLERMTEREPSAA